MDLKTLFDYHYQTNKDYIEIIAAHTGLPERVRTLMSHILNAQAIWIDRIMEVRGEKSFSLKVWEQHQDHLLLPIQNKLVSATNYVFNEFALDQSISYQNSKGKKFTNEVRDILFHIINHGSHHRAQIAMMLSREGIVPPTNDYIFRKRKEV